MFKGWRNEWETYNDSREWDNTHLHTPCANKRRKFILGFFSSKKEKISKISYRKILGTYFCKSGTKLYLLVSGTISIFESSPARKKEKNISNRGTRNRFLFEFSMLEGARENSLRLFLSMILRMTSVFPEVYATTTPSPKMSEFERGVFNRRSTATVESRSRREPPNNWHTLPRDWQLPPVPPRSCNPRHARIHGPRRRTGNRRGRSSDASCPSSTATPIPCAPSSIRVLAEAYESSSFTRKKLGDTFRYFFEFRFRPPRKQAAEAVADCSFPPPLFFDVPLLSRSANSFTTWKTRYRVNKGKRKVEERSSGYFSTIDSSNGVEARLVRARSNLSVGLENSSFLIRSILSWYLFITLSLCIVDYFLFGEKRERKWGMQSGRNADMFSFIANWEGMFELRRKGKPNREENSINKNKIVLQYSRIERSSSKINW